ncbi:ATP-binding protein [Streptomyces fulvoviolaceus]|uniref:tetratricopeptide repeat protein n=1 Tax=Streptomyces fulvoviolaceus TaxID=285535 RepID=UPI0021C01051|nr:tetratricopeptide repeat protein [Streptomyces fulvoviolaceus]MCT9080677.1 tetratricopeptide repeat protein [Streptomyces fulvoviolaceus]
MSVIGTLDEAIRVAEGMRDKSTRDPSGDESRLASFAGQLRCVDAAVYSDPTDVGKLIHLAKFCLDVGRKPLARDILDLTLRTIELAEAYEEKFEDAALNRLGALLAGLGDLVRARDFLNFALGRARRNKSQEVPRILANLSAVTLRAEDYEAAAAWAQKGFEELWGRPEGELETRLTVHRVRVDVARARRDVDQLDAALPYFAQAVEQLAALKGETHSRVFEARTALATAGYRLAAWAGDEQGRSRQLAELELLSFSAQVTLGHDHPVAIVVRAAFAAAEFDAGGGTDGVTSDRTKGALRALDAAERSAQDASSLGREHTQTRKLRAALATMRTTALPSAELPYDFEHVYRPQENEDRNKEKKTALKQEQSTIRLIAHAGASYFLSEENRFHGPLVQALDRGVYFRAIISSPWSSLAAFMQRPTAVDPLTSRNILKVIEDSQYYRETFQPVIASYQNLKAMYGDGVELRITSMDIPGSTLLTSDTFFFEPYITSNPAHRTRRGLRVLELKFLNDSKYYVDSLEEFTTQWELSSTYEQFKQHEEGHRSALQSEIDALVDIQVRPSVRKGDVPRS